MANVGRPRALDDVKRAEVCALVSAGSGIERAARYVGCNPSTIRREALRNRDFHEQLRKAEIAAELEPLRLLRQKAGTHWRAAAWLLERINPERFARREVEHLRKDQALEMMEYFIDKIVEEMPDEETSRRVLRRLLATAQSTMKESFAARHTRRDPHSRKQRRGTFPEFEGKQPGGE